MAVPPQHHLHSANKSRLCRESNPQLPQIMHPPCLFCPILGMRPPMPDVNIPTSVIVITSHDVHVIPTSLIVITSHDVRVIPRSLFVITRHDVRVIPTSLIVIARHDVHVIPTSLIVIIRHDVHAINCDSRFSPVDKFFELCSLVGQCYRPQRQPYRPLCRAALLPVSLLLRLLPIGWSSL